MKKKTAKFLYLYNDADQKRGQNPSFHKFTAIDPLAVDSFLDLSKEQLLRLHNRGFVIGRLKGSLPTTITLFMDGFRFSFTAYGWIQFTKRNVFQSLITKKFYTRTRSTCINPREMKYGLSLRFLREDGSMDTEKMVDRLIEYVDKRDMNHDLKHKQVIDLFN